jgi:hypothetical protein
MSMKYLSEKAIEYMQNVWGFNDSTSVDDMTMFWENDYYELAAKRLVEAGAVEPNCKEAKEMIEVARSVSCEMEQAVIDDCLERYTILECRQCNYVHFIPNYCSVSDWTTCDGCNRIVNTQKAGAK